MKLSDLRTGDIILVTPRNLIGSIIAKFTFGKVNHAAIVYDKTQLFETDGDQVVARFNDITKYSGREQYIVRYKFEQEELRRVKHLCNRYNKKPYSYWDILTNGILFFLARPIRVKLVRLLGTKQCMICSELVARIVYEATGDKLFKDYEGLNPEDIRQIALENPEKIKLFYINQREVN